jgi:hypothetical protein
MLIVTLTNGMVYDSEITMSRVELIEMIEDGCFIKTPIEKILEISGGTVFDITSTIAHSIWCELNADDRAPHHELEVWLNGFGHDCTDFGITPEPRSMWVPPYRG